MTSPPNPDISCAHTKAGRTEGRRREAGGSATHDSRLGRGVIRHEVQPKPVLQEGLQPGEDKGKTFRRMFHRGASAPLVVPLVSKLEHELSQHSGNNKNAQPNGCGIAS